MFPRAAGLLVVALLIPAAAQAAGCRACIETPLRLVALYDQKMALRLENENQLARLCPPGAPDRDKCAADALATERQDIRVYTAPGKDLAGMITVAYTPGKPITATLKTKDDRGPLPYTPTVYDPDWGYGPWFHATLLEKKGGWVKIALPRLGAGWIDLPGADIADYATDGAIYRLGGKNLVLLRRDGKGVTVRDEIPGEMCGTPSPVAEKMPERTLPYGALYSDACELLLLPAYLRGC